MAKKKKEEEVKATSKPKEEACDDDDNYKDEDLNPERPDGMKGEAHQAMQGVDWAAIEQKISNVASMLKKVATAAATEAPVLIAEVERIVQILSVPAMAGSEGGSESGTEGQGCGPQQPASCEFEKAEHVKCCDETIHHLVQALSSAVRHKALCHRCNE